MFITVSKFQSLAACHYILTLQRKNPDEENTAPRTESVLIWNVLFYFLHKYIYFMHIDNQSYCVFCVMLALYYYSYFILNYFLNLYIYFLLLQLSAFSPIPPPHPSQSHLPPPPLPSPLILSLCPVLYSSSYRPLSPLFPPYSPLAIVTMFLISMF